MAGIKPARIRRLSSLNTRIHEAEATPIISSTVIGLLVVANVFNIAADIAAMGEALSLVIGRLDHEHALIFAATSMLLQIFIPYRRYAPL